MTGGSGGVGRAVVEELRGRGYEVVSLSRTEGIDVGDEAQVEAGFGRIDRLEALVNNAATLIPRLLTEMTAAEWDEQVRVILRGTFLCSRAAFRRLRPGGTIVNVSSLSGVFGAEKFPRMSAYVAAKSGLAGLTEALAVEGRPLGIRVNAVGPGSVDTTMADLAGVTGPRLQPVEVARIVAWLAGPDSAPLSGANLRLEPGLTRRGRRGGSDQAG